MDTTFFSEINWLAVLVSGLAYFALGALWYSPVLFSKKWIELGKIDINDPNAKKGVGLMFGGSLLLMLISSVAIAILLNRMDLSGWKSGLKVGALVGIFFNAAGIGINYLYEKKPIALFLINAVYQILGSIIVGIIISVWQ
jgi:hypothetical protein